MEWNVKGNERFKAGKFAAAIDCYSKAIAVDKKDAVLYRYCKTVSQSPPCFSVWKYMASTLVCGMSPGARYGVG